MSEKPQKLTRRELEHVLRRAADLDGAGASAASNEGGALDSADVRKLGAEAGLQAGAIDRALDEVRRGLMLGPEDGGALTRALGPGRIVVARDVPGTPASVQRALDKFMRGQLMTVRRHHGERIEWERAPGIWPGLVRSLDFSTRYAFSLVSRVETVVAPAAEGTSVTMAIDISEMRRERMTRMALRAATGFAFVGLGGAAVLPGFGVWDLLALAGGGLFAGALAGFERRRFFESRDRVVLAPERFLDLLVQRRRRRAAAAAAAAAAGESDRPPAPGRGEDDGDPGRSMAAAGESDRPPASGRAEDEPDV